MKTKTTSAPPIPLSGGSYELKSDGELRQTCAPAKENRGSQNAVATETAKAEVKTDA